MKTCSDCLAELPVESFYRKRGVLRGKCKKCWGAETQRWFENNREKRRGYHLNDKYGMSLDEYEALSKAQDYKCVICADPPKRLYVDHNHTTGAIRGLLCRDCNSGLGLFKDKIVNLQNAITYLQD